MKRKRQWLAAALVALLVGGAWWAVARAVQPPPVRNLDDEVLEIGKLLQCPICQNVPVAFSPSPLASQMRDVIRSKVEAGESREQIVQYFVDRYGESILIEPPRRGFNLVAWRGPTLLILGAAMALFLLIQRWARVPAPPEPDDLPPFSDAELAAYEARLAEALREADPSTSQPQ